MTACGSVGALMVGGRVVGQLKCELDDGHDVALDFTRPGSTRGCAPTPHRVVLEWEDTEPVDLDLFDPDERFDVDVPIPASLTFPPTDLDRADLYGEE